MVDTHCHLDACRSSPEELVRRARAAGVRRIATVGTDEASIGRAVEAARAHEEVVAIVGRHPHEAAGFDASARERIERAARLPEARAVGETGLDYFRERAPRSDQRRAFEAQLEIAGDIDLPAVIHTRDAEEDTFAVLAEHADRVRILLHCFSAPGRLEECIDRGYMCSFAGNVTYPKASALQAAARDLPEELLLLETDSPYLAPQAIRGKPNEPANVVRTAEQVAQLRAIDYRELDALVERNSARLFRW